MTPHCKYHCRACGGHFASLEAFDAHRGGPPQARACIYPDDAALVELDGGKCEIGHPLRPVRGIVVYSTERAQRARETFTTRAARQAAGASVMEAVK